MKKLLICGGLVVLIGAAVTVANLFTNDQGIVTENVESHKVEITEEIEVAPPEAVVNQLRYEGATTSANIIKGVSFRKNFNLENPSKDIKASLLMTSKYNSEGEYIGGGTSLSAKIYVVDGDFTNYFKVSSKEDRWILDIGSDGLSSSFDQYTEEYSNILISTLGDAVEIEMNDLVTVAIIIPAKDADQLDKLIGIDGLTKKQILKELNTEVTIIEYGVFDTDDVDEKDYY